MTGFAGKLAGKFFYYIVSAKRFNIDICKTYVFSTSIFINIILFICYNLYKTGTVFHKLLYTRM